MRNADLPLARSNERRRISPSMATTPCNCSENSYHEPLKSIAKLLRTQIAKHQRESVAAVRTLASPRKAAKKWLLRFSKESHLDRPCLPQGTQYKTISNS